MSSSEECDATRKRLCTIENCIKCYDRSFASHERSQYWAPRNPLQPRQVFKNSGTKFWFNCDCGHEFDTKLCNISRKNQWCPYCVKKLCNHDDCKQCFNKSFAPHTRSKYWSNKNKLTARQVTKNSNGKFWFNCDCGHEFNARVCDITSKNSWCPYCSIRQQKLCDSNDCRHCFSKSFAPHMRSKYWSSKNKLTPRQVFKWANEKFWFNCDYGHEFNAILYDVTRGCWCPYCVNKSETLLYEMLSCNYVLTRQFKAEWCQNNSKHRLPFDFCISDLNIIIELDGPQHFRQISNWGSPKETRKRDAYKMKCANKNGYCVIRLLQEDVYYDRNEWFGQLVVAIEHIQLDNIIQNVFLCENDEYKKLQKLLP